jgi:hypothetical protein
VLLLDPKNDFVFKKLFADAPELLAALINAEGKGSGLALWHPGVSRTV